MAVDDVMTCRPLRAYGGNDESPGAGKEGGKAVEAETAPGVILQYM